MNITALKYGIQLSQSTPENGVLTPFRNYLSSSTLYLNLMAAGMIEVFKTNVEDESLANDLKAMLLQHFPGTKINFDLHDCDRILRMEGENFTAYKVVLLAEGKGVVCKILE